MHEGAETDDLLKRIRARLGHTVRGKYRLRRVLGIGGMAAVYAADHRNGKQFAVKMLHPQLSLDADVRARFLREGYLANKVKHRGAVSAIDDDVADDGAAFLVMELLDGTSVDSAYDAAGGSLPLPAIVAVALQALEVLDSAHANGVVHRDIKPANLFVTVDGEVKVLDFGIARLRDAAAIHATQSGISLGTPAFMAPEQALAKTSDIDGRTDVWAIGATMFTLATGRIVHDAENAQQVMILSATRPAPSLAALLPDASEGDLAVIAVIDKALGFLREDRWQTGRAMRDALAAASEQAFGQVPGPDLLRALAARRRVASSDRPVRPPAPPAISDLQAMTRAPTEVASPNATAPSVGMTTAQPVSSDPAPDLATVPRAQPPRTDARRGPLFAAIGGALLLGVGVLYTSSPRPTDASVASAGTASAASAASATERPAPTAPIARTIASATLPPPPAPWTPVSSGPPTSAAPDKPPTATRPAVGLRPPPPTSTPAPEPSKPRTAKPACDPPYTVDPATGKQHFKEECFPEPP